jgi:hypothetical protein
MSDGTDLSKLDPNQWHVGIAVSKSGKDPDAVLLISPTQYMYLAPDQARRMAANLIAQAEMVEGGHGRDVLAALDQNGRMVKH